MISLFFALNPEILGNPGQFLNIEPVGDLQVVEACTVLRLYQPVHFY
jgi:hypothetical protein